MRKKKGKEHLLDQPLKFESSRAKDLTCESPALPITEIAVEQLKYMHSNFISSTHLVTLSGSPVDMVPTL